MRLDGELGERSERTPAEFGLIIMAQIQDVATRVGDQNTKIAEGIGGIDARLRIVEDHMAAYDQHVKDARENPHMDEIVAAFVRRWTPMKLVLGLVVTLVVMGWSAHRYAQWYANAIIQHGSNKGSMRQQNTKPEPQPAGPPAVIPALP